MFNLEGMNALVTGASGGIGGAVARALHGQGANVALSGTRLEALEALAGDLKERVYCIKADLAHAAEADRLVSEAEAAMGSLDILVNNAGMTQDNLFIRMSDEDWERVLTVNLTAVFRLSRAAVKRMIKRRFGRIIGISSVVGAIGNAGQANYAAAKAGMIGMTKSLAQEVASRNITVNCVAPGFIATPMTEGLNEKQQDSIMAKVPMGRLGSAEEVAAACVFLASREASYVTGETVHVNGGMAML